ncbi:hypothetical protein PSH47_03715 [Pseudoalteromonas sp. CST5]|uniref:hypothetical protein n=1 Tax=unclassified Pseudoalteromonas TaxID=194690 RepID=UPI002358169E|nr:MULTISPECIES: hypothetical protein [unclassified Pseudoalteromonas]MDC9511865.1 hypothetical protein [Pseudoalteromonas sp. CST1]MDC9536101.1 hypothetical protein [Pseudoalteromonas sp. CST3]MDC9540536.1 hypothetical protein [Pseudoalteromonas sp. CST2]MDC9544446.1 hypothetical protein [Pseudoalteromonas sp. CST4]MDC9548278.1 hypothetical protein [Pseudoalteromonas sp. CST5]
MENFSKKIDMEACLRRGLYEEVTLMMAFIEQQNYQLESYTSKFSDMLLTGGRGVSSHEHSESVSVSNISNDQYDLEATFKQDLPNYIRKSQVLMLWAMLEDTFGYIVRELSSHQNMTFRAKKRNESIFLYYVKWLEKIDDRDFITDPTVVFLNSNVREVRNSLVHGSILTVSHKGLEITEAGLIISANYVWDICMSIDSLAWQL